ncbi:MAG: DUF4142 domain-containing protein [Janthinobacterium lividum]
MKRTLISAMLSGAAVVVCAPAAFAQSAASAPMSVSGDQTFIQGAAQAGATEIDASKLALKSSSDPQVKAFARRMITDHTKVANQLARNVPAGTDVPKDAPDDSVISSLQGLKGKDFDQAYIQKVGLEGHKKAVDVFQQESDSGTDPKLKSFAKMTLPSIKHHLMMAQQLAKTHHVTD